MSAGIGEGRIQLLMLRGALRPIHRLEKRLRALDRSVITVFYQ